MEGESVNSLCSCDDVDLNNPGSTSDFSKDIKESEQFDETEKLTDCTSDNLLDISNPFQPIHQFNNLDVPSKLKLRKQYLEKPSDNPNLFITSALVKGHLVYVLVDTGYNGTLLLDVDAAKRIGLKYKPSATEITIGDGSKINSFIGEPTNLQLSTYKIQNIKPKVMQLSKEFDGVVGIEFLRRLQDASKDLKTDYVNNCITGTIRSTGQEFRISSDSSSPEILTAPRSTFNYIKQNYLIKSNADTQVEWENAKLCFINLNPNSRHFFHIAHTKFTPEGDGGDEFLPCLGFHNHTLKNADEAMVEAAIKNQNPDDIRDLTWDEQNTDWIPAAPNDEETFADKDFLSRVEVGPNEGIYDRIKELWNLDIQPLLERNGQVFADHVPTHLVPDRGDNWNATLRFKDENDRRFPISKKPYRLSPDETRALAEILRDMLLRGTIRPSHSAWGTPVFLVPKALGGWRLCCDYRPLNAKLVHEAYSIPATDQLFDQLEGAKIFSTHDCTWGYHQLRWAKESIPLTAIRTHLGTFEFLTMNFGPCSAPAQWTRLMETILRPYLTKFCIVYLDDLTIYSKTPEEHMEHLEMVYRLLAKNRIFLRFGKCIFFATKIEFLGWVVEDGKLGASTKKLELVQEWPTPNSKKAVRSFVGFANFYRRLIKNYTVILKPLTDLLKDDVPDAGEAFINRWKTSHDEAFAKIKEALCTAPVVAIANPALPYILEVDASQDAVGGILSQLHDGVKHVIEYFSKRTGPSQEHYFPYKLEMLALITCLTHWRHLLLNSKFLIEIHTDHLALKSLETTKNPSRMYLRWSQFISQFKFRVIHVPGTKNPADFLSRPDPKQVLPDNDPITISEDDNTEEASPQFNYFQYFGEIMDGLNHVEGTSDQLFFAFNDSDSETEILEEQNLLPETVKSIREATGKDPYALYVSQNQEKFPKFRFERGLLWNDVSLYIPAAVPAIRKQIFQQCHGIPTAGHYSPDTTVRKIRKFYFWPNMREDIAEAVRKCEACAYRKRHNFLPRMLRPHDIPAECWDVIFMDQVSGFPSTPEGYDSIYVFVDKLSKMVHFVPTIKRGLTKEKLAEYFFQHIFRLHGLPKTIVSDRTPLVDNAFWKTLFSLVGTKFNITTPNHPQTDSSAEAHVQICTSLLRQFVNEQQNDWYSLLPAVEFAHNSTPNLTGYSPYEIVYNRTPRTPASLLHEEACKEFVPTHTTATTRQAMAGGKDLLARHQRIIRDVQAFMQKQREKMLNPGPHRRFDKRVFKPGERVLVSTKYKSKTARGTDKLAPLYEGPFRVLKVHAQGQSYTLEIPQAMKRQMNPVFNVKHLYPAPKTTRAPPEADEISSDNTDLARLTPIGTDLKIYGTFVKEHDGLFELFFETEQKAQSVHLLCCRGHFKECRAWLESPVGYYQFKLERHLGRIAYENKQDGPVGIITAYDSHDLAKPLRYSDDSPAEVWRSEASNAIKFQHKPKKMSKREALKQRQALEQQELNHLHELPKPKRVLELCSGGQSCARRIKRLYGPDVEIHTLDCDPAMKASFIKDIRHWNYFQYFPAGYFDIIWCSPPCVEYSPAKTVAARQLEEADEIVLACLKVIAQAKPRIWIIENPHTMLYKRDIMRDYERFRTTTSYCMFGYDYRKVTDIWCNIPLKLPNCEVTPCQYFAEHNHHKGHAQQGPSTFGPGYTRFQLNSVPTKLIDAILQQVLGVLQE